MRIAQLAPPFETVPPLKYGGTERVIWALTEELVRRGHDVTLFASGDSSTSAKLVPIVERAVWHHPRYELGLPFVALALDELYDRCRDFDVIHNHDQLMALPLARRHPETPTVSTLHGRLDLPEYQPLFDRFDDVPLVAISDSQRRPLPRANWLGTVYNGLPVEQFPFEAEPRPYLAFVGRISPEKGVDTAIRVALRAGLPIKLAARMPLRESGNAEARRDWDYYETIVKPLMAQPGVEYLGELGNADKTDLLRNALALLFPIRWPEPFGLVQTEALACGTPVLALRHGSTPEVVDHGITGFVQDDEYELVEAVGHVGSIRRADCRAAAERRFSARAMADGYERMYEIALSPGTSYAAPTIEAPMTASVAR
ncbi:MAG TPA: glycosyltransferase family 4 protein [Chloroflexota bacterium]|nr:glycosyltransferase family 4 protein [Chloroflexota bacterium]